MHESSTCTDKELLKSISEGEQKAFDRLFERYRDRLFHYLLKITKSNETAEEIVMDTFLKIWTGRSIITEIDNFEAFLFRIARNKALDFLRRVQKNRLRQMELWDQLQETAAAETADREILLEEINSSVRQAVNQLSPQRKMVFQLSRDHGLTYEQIGRRLHISTHTVRNHLAASLQFIRANLGPDLGMILLFFLLFSHLH